MPFEWKTLLLAYGNPDRQDDGVAWHILHGIAAQLGIEQSGTAFSDASDKTGTLKIRYLLQLVPELAEEVAGCSRVCFIDAHNSEIPEEIRKVELSPSYRSSPFSHHLTPETLLEITRTIYHAEPRALLVSVKGYKFDFSDSLSRETADLVPKAIQVILEWMKESP
jgi:hydrogenase maturation protease